GVTLVNPTVSFANNADILVGGTGSTQSITFTTAGAASLGIIDTRNFGIGPSGSVNITANPSLNVASVNTSSQGGTAGGITLTSSGPITVGGALTAAGLNNHNAGSVVLDSGTASFAVNSIYANSTDDCCVPTSGFTGAGSPGSITFKQSGGTLTNPTITFA